MAKKKAIDLNPSSETTTEPPVKPADPPASQGGEEPLKEVAPTVNPRNALLASMSRASMEETGNADAAALNSDESGIDEDAPPPNREALAAAAAAEANAAAEEEGDDQPPPKKDETPPATTTPPEPKKHKIVVRGVETEVSEDQVLEAGIHAMRHRGAAEMALREAHELLTQAKKVASSDDTSTTTGKAPASDITDDARELAKTLQLGTPEEAARVVAAMMKGGHSEQEIQGVVARTVETHVRDVLDHQSASKALETQVPEMLKDPRVMAILTFEERKARAAGDTRPYSQLYPEIGKTVRDWLDGLKGPATDAPPKGEGTEVPARTIQQRKEAKAAVPPAIAPATGAAPGSTQPKVKTGSEIVAEMRNRRGNPDFRARRI